MDSKFDWYQNSQRRSALPGTFRVVTKPSSLPIELAFVKNYLRVEHSLDDALITHLIKGAVSYAETLLNMGLMPQTVEEQINEFPPVSRHNPKAAIVLKRGPLASISTVEYFDAEGNQETLPAVNYSAMRSDKTLPVLAPVQDKSWPETADRIDAITITYVVGFASADDIPTDILDSLLLAISDQYDNRTDGVRRFPMGSELKLKQHRLDAFR